MRVCCISQFRMPGFDVHHSYILGSLLHIAVKTEGALYVADICDVHQKEDAIRCNE